MLIGLDGRPFYGALAGTGRYVTELCKALDAALPEARFLVYGTSPMQLPLMSDRWRQRGDESSLSSRLPASLWYLVRAGELAAKDGVEIFWGSANLLPLTLPANIPAVLTVYDLVFKLFPETMSWQHRLIHTLFFERSLRRADFITSISQGTSDRLTALYRRSADLVILPRAGAQFRRQDRTRIEATLGEYGIDFPYFLSVSTLEPRKNLPTLISALMQLSAEGASEGTGLVLVGQQGWKSAALVAQLNTARENGLRIVETGYVSDEDLPALYAGAKAVVMPSLYEGFGMPVLEALRCGGRVVASNTPEIREAGGDAPIYIEPCLDGIKRGLRTALEGGYGHRDITEPTGLDWLQEGQKLASLFRRQNACE